MCCDAAVSYMALSVNCKANSCICYLDLLLPGFQLRSMGLWVLLPVRQGPA